MLGRGSDAAPVGGGWTGARWGPHARPVRHGRAGTDHRRRRARRGRGRARRRAACRRDDRRRRAPRLRRHGGPSSRARSAGGSRCRAGRRRRVCGSVHMQRLVACTSCPCPGIERSHPYLRPDGAGWPDNAARFLAFSRAVAAMVRADPPDVLHLHDWHTGAVLAALPAPPPTVLTLHNIAYQGVSDGGLAAPHRSSWAPLRVVGRHEPAQRRHRPRRPHRRGVAPPCPRDRHAGRRVRPGRTAAGPRRRPRWHPQRHRHGALGPGRRCVARCTVARRRAQPAGGPAAQPGRRARSRRMARRRAPAGRHGDAPDRAEGCRHDPAAGSRPAPRADAPRRARRG